HELAIEHLVLRVDRGVRDAADLAVGRERHRAPDLAFALGRLRLDAELLELGLAVIGGLDHRARWRPYEAARHVRLRRPRRAAVVLDLLLLVAGVGRGSGARDEREGKEHARHGRTLSDEAA